MLKIATRNAINSISSTNVENSNKECKIRNAKYNICSLPLPSPMAPPSRITSTLATLSSHSSPSPPRYNLRPRLKDKGLDAVGLDLTSLPMSPKNSRGRPSRISKARHTADEEVALGRQQTIFRALRARIGPSPLPS